MESICVRARAWMTWCILTASTIGPGSVAVCAKAGAEFGVSLAWCAVVAAAVSWTMQDAAGRLAISAGSSLGQAVRSLSPRGVPRLLRLLLTAFVLVGSLAYECNIFSGTLSAITMLTDDWRLQLSAACINGPLCIALVLSGSTASVSAALGFVAFGMVVLFGVVVSMSGLEPGFAAGLIPSFPHGSVPVALGVMGTTAVPLNLLLSSALARGVTMSSMREGVAISSLLTGVISVLILAVGVEAHSFKDRAHGEAGFELNDLAEVLRGVAGESGVRIFAIGLYGAGISSALTVPIGSALAVEDLLGWQPKPLANQHATDKRHSRCCSAAASESPTATDKGGGAGQHTTWSSWGRRALMCSIIVLGMVPSLLNLPTMAVIMTAQLVNGMLLPFVSASLVICINDSCIMGSRIASRLGNAAIAPCLAASFFLASMVVVGKAIGGLAMDQEEALLSIVPSTVMTVIGLAFIFFYAWRVRRGTLVTLNGQQQCLQVRTSN